MTTETESLIERLPAMTAIELRAVAREHNLRITHLVQRPKPDLLRMVEAALREQS